MTDAGATLRYSDISVLEINSVSVIVNFHSSHSSLSLEFQF